MLHTAPAMKRVSAAPATSSSTVTWSEELFQTVDLAALAVSSAAHAAAVAASSGD